jgi:hypothetical protein
MQKRVRRVAGARVSEGTNNSTHKHLSQVHLWARTVLNKLLFAFTTKGKNKQRSTNSRVTGRLGARKADLA